MGAFLAAASSAPMMAIVMIFEMTASYQVMLPLMLACVIAYFVANAKSGAFMYDIMNKRKRSEEERLRVAQTQMRDLIRPAETVLPLSASLRDMTDMFARHPVKYIYIVDAAQRYQGVVALQDLTAQMMDEVAIQQKHASDFVRRGFLPALTPTLSLEQALQHFLQHQGERLPVVQDLENPVLLGAVHKTSLLDAYVRLQSLGH
jgi:CIC family chloride channel protein